MTWNKMACFQQMTWPDFEEEKDILSGEKVTSAINQELGLFRGQG